MEKLPGLFILLVSLFVYLHSPLFRPVAAVSPHSRSSSFHTVSYLQQPAPTDDLNEVTSSGLIAEAIESLDENLETILQTTQAQQNAFITYQQSINSQMMRMEIRQSQVQIGEDNFQIQELQRQINALEVEIAAANLGCDGNIDCRSCAQSSSCVWCVSTQSCTEGSSTGATTGDCPNYEYQSCQSVVCESRNTCEDCLGRSDCGWCVNGEDCIPANTADSVCDPAFYFQQGLPEEFNTCPDTDANSVDVTSNGDPRVRQVQEYQERQQELRDEVAALQSDIDTLTNLLNMSVAQVSIGVPDNLEGIGERVDAVAQLELGGNRQSAQVTTTSQIALTPVESTPPAVIEEQDEAPVAPPEAEQEELPVASLNVTASEEQDELLVAAVNSTLPSEQEELQVVSLNVTFPEEQDELPVVSLNTNVTEEQDELPAASLNVTAPEEQEELPVVSLNLTVPQEEDELPALNVSVPQEQDEISVVSLNVTLPEEQDEVPVVSLNVTAPEEQDELPVASQNVTVPEEESELPVNLTVPEEEDELQVVALNLTTSEEQVLTVNFTAPEEQDELSIVTVNFTVSQEEDELSIVTVNYTTPEEQDESSTAFFNLTAPEEQDELPVPSPPPEASLPQELNTSLPTEEPVPELPSNETVSEVPSEAPEETDLLAQARANTLTEAEIAANASADAQRAAADALTFANITAEIENDLEFVYSAIENNRSATSFLDISRSVSFLQQEDQDENISALISTADNLPGQTIAPLDILYDVTIGSFLEIMYKLVPNH